MNCAEAENLFDADLDGELTGSLRLEFDAHRLRCRRCQQTLVMMEAVGHVISAEPRPPELSYDFTANVIANIETGPPLLRRLRSRRVAVAAVVILQAAAVLVFAMWYPFGSTTTPIETLDNELGTFANGNLAAVPADFEAWDGVDLYEYIYEGVERLQSGSPHWGAEFAGLARYAVSFKVSDDVAHSSVRYTDISPWGMLGDLVTPATRTPEESEPASATGNVFPL